jgi:hypothetical protein
MTESKDIGSGTLPDPCPSMLNTLLYKLKNIGFESKPEPCHLA